MPTAIARPAEQYSRAYIHHLIKSDEILGWHLLGIHNMTFYHRLMREMTTRAFCVMTFSLTMRRNDSNWCEATKSTPAARQKKPRPLGPPVWAITKSTQSAQGFSSIRQMSSGEVMHSVSAPSDEANKLYVEQSFLASRLLKRRGPGRRAGDLGRRTRCGLKCHGRHSLL